MGQQRIEDIIDFDDFGGAALYSYLIASRDNLAFRESVGDFLNIFVLHSQKIKKRYILQCNYLFYQMLLSQVELFI